MASWILLCGAVLLALSGCSEPVSEPAEPVFKETGDLQALQARRYLRILIPRQEPVSLERRGMSVTRDLDLAKELAETLGLKPMVIRMRDRGEMMASLLDGRGDLVLARLTATPDREKRFAFSTPTGYVREMLVVRKGNGEFRSLNDLEGLPVTVRPSSSFYETLLSIQEKVPGLRIRLAPEEKETEELLYEVQRGMIQATVADEDMVREAEGYLHEIRPALALTEARPVAWALRKRSPELKKAVDAFLHEKALAGYAMAEAGGDLPEIEKRKVLRVLTRNVAGSYFLYRGEQMGFEYELVKKFAETAGLRIQIVVPAEEKQLIPWLLEGKGDLVASMIAVTPDRKEKVLFSRPYFQAAQVVVGRREEPAMDGPGDLAGREIAVRSSSASLETLERLRETIPFRIRPVDERVETAALIRGVGDGIYDLSVTDETDLRLERSYRDDVHALLKVSDEADLAWAVRPDSPLLLDRVNRFLDAQYRGKFYNVLVRKYFGDKRSPGRAVDVHHRSNGALSPYDALFRKYGREVEIDWRLLAAQAYQESRFRPDARSWAGAVGVMQIMPAAAEEVGVTGDLEDPEVGIRAGALYLRWLLDRFRDGPQDYGEQLRFALGAYNAGRGHVLDGRRVAETIGKNPNRWFDNVEDAMVLLRKPEFAAVSRFGYCRGDQPKKYVREITDRYLSYAQVSR